MAKLMKSDIELKEGEVFNKWLMNRLIRHNKNAIICTTGPTGCHPLGTQILMANGEWKNVEDIKNNDIVLSPQQDGSNTYSKVVNTTKWFCNDNYDVVENNRTNKLLYSCSYNHIIPVYKKFKIRGTKDNKRYVKNKWWDFSSYDAKTFSEMASESKSHQNIGFSSFLIDKFKDRDNCEVEPYTLGVFLGDGMFKDTIEFKLKKEYYNPGRCDKKLFNKRSSKIITITSNDKEIMEEVSKYYPIMAIRIKQRTMAKNYAFSVNSELSLLLEKYGLNGKKSGDKFIPREALLSDANYRKRLLAGLIDTDGSYKGGGYCFTLKSKRLIEDIRSLVYSLGGRCGEIRKKICRIKSINFQGTYYNLSLYLGKLELPLMIKRKKRDVNTIYLNSNRVAINSIKNNKSCEVYGFELDSRSKWYITDNWMVTHNSGKSYQDLRRAELWYKYYFKKEFPVGNICFSVAEAMNKIKDPNIPRGSIIIFEEAGANFGSLDFQNKISKMFNYTLQTFRSKNIALFINLPYLTMMNKSGRMLVHVHFQTGGIDFDKKLARSKAFFIQINQSNGKIYNKYLRIRHKGKVRTIKMFNYGLPSERIINAYENKKVKYLSDLTTEFAKEIEQIEQKKLRKMMRDDLTDVQRETYNLMMECNGDYKKVARIRGTSDRNIQYIIRSIKNKGYVLKFNKKGIENEQIDIQNHIPNPI